MVGGLKIIWERLLPEKYLGGQAGGGEGGKRWTNFFESFNRIRNELKFKN